MRFRSTVRGFEYGNWLATAARYLEIAGHPHHVIARFGVRRDAVVPIDRILAGVICGDRSRVVVFVIVEEEFEVPDTALDVFACVERIRHPEAPGSGRDQLHHSQRAFRADRPRVVVAFSANHGMDE